MGTETLQTTYHHYNHYTYVKLNNPQMGTEINAEIPNTNTALFMFVKLNNPLMGTETIHPTEFL